MGESFTERPTLGGVTFIGKPEVSEEIDIGIQAPFPVTPGIEPTRLTSGSLLYISLGVQARRNCITTRPSDFRCEGLHKSAIFKSERQLQFTVFQFYTL